MSRGPHRSSLVVHPFTPAGDSKPMAPVAGTQPSVSDAAPGSRVEGGSPSWHHSPDGWPRRPSSSRQGESAAPGARELLVVKPVPA